MARCRKTATCKSAICVAKILVPMAASTVSSVAHTFLSTSVRTKRLFFKKPFSDALHTTQIHVCKSHPVEGRIEPKYGSLSAAAQRTVGQSMDLCAPSVAVCLLFSASCVFVLWSLLFSRGLVCVSPASQMPGKFTSQQLLPRNVYVSWYSSAS